MIEYQGYVIKADKLSPRLVKVSVAGHGGKIPLVLESLYTSVGVAKDSIDSYLANKGTKNGKAGSES